MTAGISLALGIDLGGSHIGVGVVDGTGKLIAREVVPTLVAAGPEGVIADLAGAARRIIVSLSDDRGSLVGAGVGVAALVDHRQGTVEMAPNLKWYGVPLKSILEEELGLPVLLENDANAAALGENWVGAGAGTRHMICVTVGTGIGGGLILGGRLHRGAGGFAGEVGHLRVAEDGPLCGCGRHGCLEAVASATAMAREGAALLARRLASGTGHDTPLGRLAEGDPARVNTRMLFEADRQGDGGAAEIINRAARFLGLGLAQAVNLLNPEVIVIGGGVGQAGERFLDPVRNALATSALEEPASRVRVVAAGLGTDAGILGAASLFLNPDMVAAGPDL